jgi:hypothetical protein
MGLGSAAVLLEQRWSLQIECGGLFEFVSCSERIAASIKDYELIALMTKALRFSYIDFVAWCFSKSPYCLLRSTELLLKQPQQVYTGC